MVIGESPSSFVVMTASISMTDTGLVTDVTDESAHRVEIDSEMTDRPRPISFQVHSNSQVGEK